MVKVRRADMVRREAAICEAFQNEVLIAIGVAIKGEIKGEEVRINYFSGFSWN